MAEIEFDDGEESVVLGFESLLFAWADGAIEVSISYRFTCYLLCLSGNEVRLRIPARQGSCLDLLSFY